MILLFAPFLLLFASCGNPTGTGEESKKDTTASFDLAAVKSTIAETNKTFSDAVVKGDSTTITNLYASDAHILPPNMPAATSHEAIQHVSGGFTSMGIKSFSLESTDVYGGPEMVVEEGKYTVGDGSGKTVDEGKYIVLWKQEDGKWKLYRDIWNSNLPAPGSK